MRGNCRKRGRGRFKKETDKKGAKWQCSDFSHSSGHGGIAKEDGGSKVSIIERKKRKRATTASLLERCKSLGSERGGVG